MYINLERYAYHDEYTLGRLSLTETVLHTIERPWLGNKRFVSCIPQGRYTVVRRYTEKRGYHWILLEVPERDLVLIHPANWVHEIEGCIAPGTKLSWDTEKNQHMVNHSQDAMKLLDQGLNGLDSFELNITTFIPAYP